jgi:putative ABC transport system substrate-binding protein
LANDLVHGAVDVIVSQGTPPTTAAQSATAAIPIVFSNVTDPVSQHFVASLAHPGGNLTGVTNVPVSVIAKPLEILSQLVPGLSRVAVVVNFDPANQLAVYTSRLQAIKSAADTMAVQLHVLDIRSVADVEPALADALAWQTEAIMSTDGQGAVLQASPRIVEFAKQNHIPTTFPNKEYVGGLLAYGPNPAGAGRLAATYVDRILRGASPGDLPVQEPTTFDFIVNQTTADAIGITIPPAIAQQVTQWYQ